MAADPILNISLFGSLSISGPDGIVTVVAPSRAGALIALLALDASKSRTWAREEIVDALWPEDDVDEAKHKLRQTLYDVRRMLEALNVEPDSVLIASRSSLQLRSERVVIDVANFESAMREATLDLSSSKRLQNLLTALNLYRGELLPGFYQEKLLSEKTRLADAYHDALKSLAAIYEEARLYDMAIEAARKLVSMNPLSEEAHFALMRLYAQLGQPSAVLKQYQQLERTLKEELNEEPGEAARRSMEVWRAMAQANAVDRPMSSSGANPEAVYDAPRGDIAPRNDDFDSDESPPVVVTPAVQIDPPFSVRARYAWCVVSAVAILLCFVAERLHHKPHLIAPPPADNSTGVTELHQPHVLARYVHGSDEIGSQPNALTTDDDGNLYVAGFVQTKHNDTDYLTLKYDSSGHELWRREYNGIGNDVDRLKCIAVDKDGNVYVTGESDNGKGNGSTHLSGLDVVTIKYDRNGNQQWVRCYNDIDNGDDRPVKLLVDTSGNAYILAACRRLKNNVDAGCDFVLLKYDGSGKMLWKRRYDGDAHNDDVPTDMVLAYQDHGVCVCGYSRGHYRSGPEYDYVTIRYTANGDRSWIRRYGEGNGADDYARGVSIDQDDNVYVIGEGRGASGSLDETRTGAIMVKYSPQGELLWARGTSREADRLQHISVATFWKDGCVAIAGATLDANGASMYRVEQRGADGSVVFVRDLFARFHPMGNIPVALDLDPNEILTHDHVWAVGTDGSPTNGGMEAFAAVVTHSGTLRMAPYQPNEGSCAALAAVGCRLRGRPTIIIAALATDQHGKGGLTLFSYTE